jgi:hypothetical protein
LDLLQGRPDGRENLPWIRSAIQTLRLMRPTSEGSVPHMMSMAANLERMARSVYPDFRVPDDETRRVPPATDRLDANPDVQAGCHYPSMPFGLNASSSTPSPLINISPGDMELPPDLTASGGGWNFDFATADMEAFLSFSPSLPLNPY